MKNFRIIAIITAIAALFVPCSCTQNDGRIGIFFGTWANTSMTVNGTEDKDFDPDRTTWTFQGDVVLISLLGDYNQIMKRFGTWSDEGDRLILNFTHHDDTHAPGTDVYSAPEWLGFPQNTIIELKYSVKENRRMILTRTADNGDIYTYTLKKTW